MNQPCEWLLEMGYLVDGCGAEEKLLVMRQLQTRKQSNGYIIFKEIKVFDRMAGRGEREVCMPRFSLFTDICPLSAPYFLNTGLISFLPHL